MKTNVHYIVIYSYSNGLLTSTKTFSSREDAKAWEETYVTEFPDTRKWFYTDRITTKRVFFFWEKPIKWETIRKWFEEE